MMWIFGIVLISGMKALLCKGFSLGGFLLLFLSKAGSSDLTLTSGIAFSFHFRKESCKSMLSVSIWWLLCSLRLSVISFLS